MARSPRSWRAWIGAEIGSEKNRRASLRDWSAADLLLAPEDTELRRRECRALLELIRKAGSPASTRRYERGEAIQGEGKPAPSLCVLIQGLAKLSVGRCGGKK